MKPQELRIGNLVTDEFYDSFKTVIEIDSINESGINLLIEDDGRWLEIAEHFIVPEYSFDKLKPIPLTEEWLLKFGFEISRYQKPRGQICGIELYAGWDYAFIRVGFKTDFIIRFYKGRFKLEPFYSCEIKHVHQLQNLYFALTGEELKINKKNN